MSLKPINRQVFTASGTWRKPPSARAVRVQLLGAGSGGGGGGRAAVGVASLAGCGGAAGVYVESWYTASELPSTLAIAVGTGGLGGAASPSDSTIGTTGGTGGTSRFGSLLRTATAWRPSGPGGTISGLGGLIHLGENLNANGYPGSGTQNTSAGFPGPQSTAQPANNQPGGGSQGGGVSAANAFQIPGHGINNGAMGDANVQQAGATGVGVGAGGDAVPVASPRSLLAEGYLIPWYSGAGGGGSTGGTGPVVQGSGGNGGDAQGYGAGGGGGGSSRNGFGCGRGGNGADGICIVTSYK